MLAFIFSPIGKTITAALAVLAIIAFIRHDARQDEKARLELRDLKIQLTEVNRRREAAVQVNKDYEAEFEKRTAQVAELHEVLDEYEVYLAQPKTEVGEVVLSAGTVTPVCTGGDTITDADASFLRRIKVSP